MGVGCAGGRSPTRRHAACIAPSRLTAQRQQRHSAAPCSSAWLSAPVLQRLLDWLQTNHTEEPELYLKHGKICGDSPHWPASEAGHVYVWSSPTVSGPGSSRCHGAAGWLQPSTHPCLRRALEMGCVMKWYSLAPRDGAGDSDPQAIPMAPPPGHGFAPQQIFTLPLLGVCTILMGRDKWRSPTSREFPPGVGEGCENACRTVGHKTAQRVKVPGTWHRR